jgi:membrane protease YdiL (CAAX protease family)
MIFGKKENWIRKLLIFSYPAIMIPIGFIPFGEDNLGMFLSRFGRLLLRDFLLISILIFVYRFELEELYVKNKRIVFIAFGTFFVPIVFVVVVKLLEPFLGQSAKVDLVIYWTEFFFGFPSMFVEEFFFRGFGIGIMKKNGFKTWFSICISVLVFAIFHVKSLDLIIIQMIPRIISGTIFSLLLIKFKKISIPIIAHILWNLVLTTGISLVF